MAVASAAGVVGAVVLIIIIITVITPWPMHRAAGGGHAQGAFGRRPRGGDLVAAFAVLGTCRRWT
eukprot:425583-Pyramimonas_sp.AAC.1